MAKVGAEEFADFGFVDLVALCFITLMLIVYFFLCKVKTMQWTTLQKTQSLKVLSKQWSLLQIFDVSIDNAL